MKEDLKKLQEFIGNNPPLNEKGEPEWWSESDWKKQLDTLIPNWRELLKNPEVWKQIKGIRPKRAYDYLLEVILEYAPSEILKDYLESEDSIERKIGYKILIEDNAKKLTVKLWNMLNMDAKIWIISKIAEEVFERPYPRFWKELDILIHDPEYFFERWRRRGYYPWIYPYIVPLAIADIALHEPKDILHPLWIKLKGTIEESNDLASMQKIWQIEHEFKEKLQRIIEKLKPLLHYPFWEKFSPVSKNVLFDPSLLLDYEKAQKAFNFMKEYHKEFNFFISRSFYEFLGEYGESNRWYKMAEFFESEKDISPRRILKMMEKHRGYFTYFEIPKEIYREKYAYFYENLYEDVEYRELVEILFEEWVFLQEFSWIVAKSKKAFEKFKEAGAVVIEFSEKAVDKLVKRTLKKKDDDFISTFDRLRALGKWVAVGGSSVTSFFNPLAGSLIGFGTGIFLLLDPEEYQIWG